MRSASVSLPSFRSSRRQNKLSSVEGEIDAEGEAGGEEIIRIVSTVRLSVEEQGK
jgi:hypothetical protein